MVLGALLLTTGGATFGAEPPKSTLFPSPFLVEHHLVQSADGDSDWQTEPVTDYYGGSWIVSVRPDGARTVIDLARREITEVQTGKGTYWTLSFSRMAELRQRLQRAEADPTATSRKPASRDRTDRAKPAIKVEEINDRATRANGSRTVDSDLLSKPGVRHFRASTDAANGSAASVEAWFDGAVRLSKEARRALNGFETEALGATETADNDVSHAELMAAARDGADGAFPVRTRREARARNAVGAQGSGRNATPRRPGLVVEDVVSRLEPIPALPQKLLTVPETFKRIPSPLEAMVSFAEEEAAHSSTALAHPEGKR